MKRYVVLVRVFPTKENTVNWRLEGIIRLKQDFFSLNLKMKRELGSFSVQQRTVWCPYSIFSSFCAAWTMVSHWWKVTLSKQKWWRRERDKVQTMQTQSCTLNVLQNSEQKFCGIFIVCGATRFSFEIIFKEESYLIINQGRLACMFIQIVLVRVCACVCVRVCVCVCVWACVCMWLLFTTKTAYETFVSTFICSFILFPFWS